jgi:CrcB protein
MANWMSHALWVGLGGAAGAMCRYGINVAGSRIFPHYPVGTLVANVFGALAIGVLAGVVLDAPRRQLELLVGVGFLGGLTTFSTYTLELLSMTHDHKLWRAALHMVLNNGLALVGVGLGYHMGRLLR